MAEIDKIELLFFKVLEDLHEYLESLTLVGGWLPHVYSKFLWYNLPANPVTTVDIDFGFGEAEMKKPPKTIFAVLLSLDYTQRHPRMDRIFPVVLHKKGVIPIDFITFPGISARQIDDFIGREIEINKIDKFGFLLEHRISINVKNFRTKKRLVI